MSLKFINSDYSDIESTSCYCSTESAKLIRDSISNLPIDAIHYIGTGDYHYISLFNIERICEDFCLVLIDNHPDDQKGAFDLDLLSCGSWVREARELKNCISDIWINSYRELSPFNLPVYLSIDLDVLSSDFAHTDWSQGDMTLAELLSLVRWFKDNCRILGIDICGGLSESKGGSEEDAALNESTIKSICSLFT